MCDSVGLPLDAQVLLGAAVLSVCCTTPAFCLLCCAQRPECLRSPVSGEFPCGVAVRLPHTSLTSELCLGVWGEVRAKGRS